MRHKMPALCTLPPALQATYNTVPEWPHKASAFVVFPDVMSACQGASGACLPCFDVPCKLPAKQPQRIAGCRPRLLPCGRATAAFVLPRAVNVHVPAPHCCHCYHHHSLQCCATRRALTRWRCLTAPPCGSARPTRTCCASCPTSRVGGAGLQGRLARQAQFLLGASSKCPG